VVEGDQAYRCLYVVIHGVRLHDHGECFPAGAKDFSPLLMPWLQEANKQPWEDRYMQTEQTQTQV
jgi:hypothetical protein